MINCLLAFILCLTFQNQDNSQDLEAAMLEATIASQEAFQLDSRSSMSMHLDALERAKRGVVKPNVRASDGFGAIIDGVYYFPNNKTKQLAIDHYRAKLKAVKEKAKSDFETMPPVISVYQLRKGQVGFLGESQSLPSEIKVLQVLGPDSFLAKVERETILFTELSTQDLTDGKYVTMPRPVQVLGTERYTTAAGGTNTVFAVRLLKREEFLKAYEFVEKNRLKVKPVYRNWFDTKKELIVEGEFIGQDKVNLTVKDRQGNEQQIPLTKLSREDRAWLKDQ